ncbi:hypothetical protein C6P08_06820 [Weissella confusa]|uniref:pyocin knob domain-containing protein n=1 Tax=Weissella confusa TaxID=1583 RepID=UPI0010920C4B|nr:pyocin knob domain-containing protein [Weissella confusa]MBJ7694275.1 hypothetical protein [Weissella confusa]QBZ04910.1 hypothetical protein C6P08_06820 [Weissella confusa]
MTITGYTFDRAKVTAEKDALLYHVLSRANQGILPGYGDEFDVKGSGLNVIVGTGFAMMSGRLIENDAQEKVSVPPNKTGSIALVIDLTVLNESSGQAGTDSYHFSNKQIQLKFIEEKLNPVEKSEDAWKQYFVEGDLTQGDTLIKLRLAYGTSDMQHFNFTKFMRREFVEFAEHGFILNTGSKRLGITTKDSDIVLNSDDDVVINADCMFLNTPLHVKGWATFNEGISAQKIAYFEKEFEVWGHARLKGLTECFGDLIADAKATFKGTVQVLRELNVEGLVLCKKGLQVLEGLWIKSGKLQVDGKSEFSKTAIFRQGIRTPNDKEAALTEWGAAKSLRLVPIEHGRHLNDLRTDGRYVWSNPGNKNTVGGLPYGIDKEGAWFTLDVVVFNSGQNGSQILYDSGHGRNAVYYRTLSAGKWEPWRAISKNVRGHKLQVLPNIKVDHAYMDVDGETIHINIWGARGIKRGVNGNQICKIPDEYAPWRLMSVDGVVDNRWARFVVERNGTIWLANWDPAANKDGNADVCFSFMMGRNY